MMYLREASGVTVLDKIRTKEVYDRCGMAEKME